MLFRSGRPTLVPSSRIRPPTTGAVAGDLSSGAPPSSRRRPPHCRTWPRRRRFRPRRGPPLRKNEVQRNQLACMLSSVVNVINGVQFQRKMNLRQFVRTSLKTHGSAVKDLSARVKTLQTLSTTAAASGSSTSPTYQSLRPRPRDL